MEELTERQKSILRLIVQEYVHTATPVPSEAITSRYRLGVSPATVRNEMALLEEKG
ncbi:MAG: HrcA family transcriptional regulator, partial [Chloroflexi bacterium]|nr:HrcA family transcriptional regulator [Chloroflexota bacterium]